MQKSKFDKQFKDTTLNDTVASPQSYSLPLLTIIKNNFCGLDQGKIVNS